MYHWSTVVVAADRLIWRHFWL